MKGKSLVVAIFIVLGALASFTVWQQGNLLKLDVDNVGFFKQRQDNLVVQYGQKLFWIAPDKQLIKQVNIADFNLRAVGDYDFFSNGDLLIYHRQQPLSLLDNIKAYLRLSSEVQLNQSTRETGDGFYRCQLEVNQCQRFGYQLPFIERSFRLDINQVDDSLYLANTSAHQLYKINGKGHVIASNGDDQFIFPNQIALVENKLWLADTNHHRIATLSTDSDNFAQPLNSFTTQPDEAHQFPHQFTVDGNHIWVNIADNTMANGLIQQYDRSGKVLKTANLEHVSDPLSMVIWQDKLLVADFITAQIEQLTLQGQSVGLLNVAPLTQLLSIRKAQTEEAELISQYGQLGFTITLLLGSIAAWKLEGSGRKTDREIDRKETSSGQYSSSESQEKSDELGVVWIDNNAKKFKRKIYQIALLYVLPCFALLIGFNFETELIDVLINVIIVYVLACFFLLYLMNYLSKVKVGVCAGRVHLYARGISTVTDFNELTLSSGYLFCENVVIPVGSGRFYLFEKTKLQALLLSQLNSNNCLSDNHTNKRLWKLKEPLFVSSLLMVVVLFILW